MRIPIYIVILALTFFAPVQRLDVAKLLPVDAVAIYIDNGAVVLETDTENKGRGEDAQKALEDLKQRAISVIYLDTAQYLLVDKNAASYADALRGYLKPSVKVALCDARGQVKETAKYLRVHGGCVPLREWKIDASEKIEKRKISA